MGERKIIIIIIIVAMGHRGHTLGRSQNKTP